MNVMLRAIPLKSWDMMKEVFIILEGYQISYKAERTEKDKLSNSITTSFFNREARDWYVSLKQN